MQDHTYSRTQTLRPSFMTSARPAIARRAPRPGPAPRPAGLSRAQLQAIVIEQLG